MMSYKKHTIKLNEAQAAKIAEQILITESGENTNSRYVEGTATPDFLKIEDEDGNYIFNGSWNNPNGSPRPFGYYDGIMYVGDVQGTHISMMEDQGFEDYIQREDLVCAGRFWSEAKYIVFWDEDVDDIGLKKVINDLTDACAQAGIDCGNFMDYQLARYDYDDDLIELTYVGTLLGVGTSSQSSIINKKNESDIVLSKSQGLRDLHRAMRDDPHLDRMYRDVVEEDKDNLINEMDSSDVNLSSFEPKDSLNEKFWYNDKLNSRVRLRLMDIVDDFVKELAVDWVEPKDVVFTGSLANYNWSKYSDIDIHVIYDFSKIYPSKPEFVEDYFNTKKDNWKKTHEIKIYGFPVELYVEDSKLEKKEGRYSINKNEWINKPKNLQEMDLDEDYIKDEVVKYATEIERLENCFKSTHDEHKIEEIGKKVRRLLKRLKEVRTNSLKTKKAEYSNGNIIYKCLRRYEYLDKAWELYNKTYDRSKSLR